MLYPNPNSGSFNIEFSLKEKSDVNVSVVDVNGTNVWKSDKLNYTSGSKKINVPLKEVSNGLYFVELQITSGDKTNIIRRKISVLY
jgi:hypothetical protein